MEQLHALLDYTRWRNSHSSAWHQSTPNHNPNADSDQTLMPPLLCVYQSTEIAGKLLLYSSFVA